MTVELPNIRKLFVPDKGYIIFDADLSGADAQVVAWEANDPELKRWLAEGVDMHVRHCAEVGGETQILNLNKESYAYHKLRQSYKHATHAVHYVGGDKAISMHPSINWSISKARLYRANYLKRRPGIQEWHNRVQAGLERDMTTWNQFGYRIIYFDRIDTLLPQAVAWIPQSTVAITCFKGALRMKRYLPWAEILIQVHDSVVFQVPFHRSEQHSQIIEVLCNPVPYPDPLTIPWKLAKSEKSWGDCSPV